jgi:hypothetical protein
LSQPKLRVVSNADAVNRERRVTIAARVPPDLAEAMAALADAGDRTVSREVFRAIRAHVEIAGASLPSRPRTPAAFVRDPDPAGSRYRTEREGDER